MKAVQRIGLYLCTLVLLFGCALDEDPAAEPDFLPGVGFGTITPKVFVDMGSNPDQGEQARYMLQAPLLTSFKRNSGIKAGNAYSMPILDSVMDIEVIPQSGGSVFLFQGTIADDSGWLTVLYDQSSKTFSFEQCVYIKAKYGAGTNQHIRAVIHSEGRNIQLDSDGYFHALFDVSYAMYYAESEEWEIFSATGELYRGVMNSGGDIGIGFGFYNDPNEDPETGTRAYVHPMGDPWPESLGETPTSMSLSNYGDWYSFLVQDAVTQLDNNNVYWAVHCKLDGSDAIFRFDSVDNPGIADYETCLSDVGNGEVDLSTWGSNSLIIPLIP